jgi:hypothetical protein
MVAQYEQKCQLTYHQDYESPLTISRDNGVELLVLVMRDERRRRTTGNCRRLCSFFGHW